MNFSGQFNHSLVQGYNSRSKTNVRSTQRSGASPEQNPRRTLPSKRPTAPPSSTHASNPATLLSVLLVAATNSVPAQPTKQLVDEESKCMDMSYYFELLAQMGQSEQTAKIAAKQIGQVAEESTRLYEALSLPPNDQEQYISSFFRTFVKAIRKRLTWSGDEVAPEQFVTEATALSWSLGMDDKTTNMAIFLTGLACGRKDGLGKYRQFLYQFIGFLEIVRPIRDCYESGKCFRTAMEDVLGLEAHDIFGLFGRANLYKIVNDAVRALDTPQQFEMRIPLVNYKSEAWPGETNVSAAERVMDGFFKEERAVRSHEYIRDYRHRDLIIRIESSVPQTAVENVILTRYHKKWCRGRVRDASEKTGFSCCLGVAIYGGLCQEHLQEKEARAAEYPWAR